ASVFAQPSPLSPALRLKTREIRATNPVNDRVEAAAPNSFGGGGHMLLQFSDPPTVDTIAELEHRGIRVLQTVPENGLLVAMEGPARLEGMQVHYAASIAPSD